jgi:hypothetical protein
VVDYNGKAMLCCQVRSDAPEHSAAIIGDLTSDDYSLSHFYRDLAPAREALLAPGVKDGVCRSCLANLGGPDKLGRIHLLASALAMIPGTAAAAGWLWENRSRYRRYETPHSSRLTAHHDKTDARVTAVC